MFTFPIDYTSKFSILLRLPDVSREGLKFCPWTFFFVLSIRLALQPRSGRLSNVFRGSVVGKASTIGIEISPTPPLIFTWVKKCKIWRRFQHHSTLSRSRSKMQQDIRPLKQISCVGMIALCPRQVWWSWVHAPLKTVGHKCRTPKTAWRKRAKSLITQRWISSNFVQSLNAWHQKCCKSSMSGGQRSRSRRDITCAKIRKIINNSFGNCSISLKSRTDWLL